MFRKSGYNETRAAEGGRRVENITKIARGETSADVKVTYIQYYTRRGFDVSVTA